MKNLPLAIVYAVFAACLIGAVHFLSRPHHTLAAVVALVGGIVLGATATRLLDPRGFK